MELQCLNLVSLREIGMNWNEIRIIQMALNGLNIGLAVPVTLEAITYTIAVRKRKRSPLS